MRDLSGYNPMRWNCEIQGCFNIKKRPKIEMFKECFPGKISFGDIDGIVEISGNALMLEWKALPVSLNTGQQIMYERLTDEGRVTVLLLAGNAETMEVTYSAWFFRNKHLHWKECTLDKAKDHIKAWVRWSKQHPHINTSQEEKRT